MTTPTAKPIDGQDLSEIEIAIFASAFARTTCGDTSFSPDEVIETIREEVAVGAWWNAVRAVRWYRTAQLLVTNVG